MRCRREGRREAYLCVLGPSLMFERLALYPGWVGWLGIGASSSSLFLFLLSLSFFSKRSWYDRLD